MRSCSRWSCSLHGHTNHSRESLYFIGEHASRLALLRRVLARLERRAQRATSIKLDFWKGFWTPPLARAEAFRVERKQIEEGLGMQSLISLTDHDNIEAPLLLRVVPEARRIPVSLEWSIHFEGTIFHLGVHNLPTMHEVSETGGSTCCRSARDPRANTSIVARYGWTEPTSRSHASKRNPRRTHRSGRRRARFITNTGRSRASDFRPGMSRSATFGWEAAPP